MVFGGKNSDLFLLHKIKSFGLKKVLDLFFKNKKKKMVFGFIKDLICFEKKKSFFDNRKIRSGLYMLKKMKKIF